MLLSNYLTARTRDLHLVIPPSNTTVLMTHLHQGLWVCLLFFKTGSAITVQISEGTCLPVARHKATTAIGAASVKQRQPSAGEASPGQSANICFQFILAMSHKLWTEAGMLIIPQVSTSTVGITHYAGTHAGWRAKDKGGRFWWLVAQESNLRTGSEVGWTQ